MELKEKLQVTENKINSMRYQLRSIEIFLEQIKHHKETHSLVTKEEINKIVELEDTLLNIEMSINEYLVLNID